MKIQIIYLDPHDDHASARDKLNACQAQRAVLVWPDRGRILTRRLDLVLLDRHARNRGVQIGLVAHEPGVRRHAQSLGIPIFDTVDDVTQETWRTRGPAPGPMPPTERDRAQIRETLLEGRSYDLPQSGRGIGQWVIGSLAIGALLVLATALLPSATITMLPELETQVIELDITLDPGLASPIGDGSIAANPLCVTVQGELSRPTSTFVSVPTEHASGSVEFTNLTSDPITIPSGTGLRTTGQPALRFETTAAASLPGGPDSTVLVEVLALEPGHSGNVPADTILAIEGLLGLEISVRNPEPTSGGLEEQRSAVSLADLDQLEQELLQILLDNAEAMLLADLAEGDILVAESLAISRVISQQFDHAAGEAAETVGLSMELEISGLAYTQADLERALGQAMQGELAGGIQGIPGSLEIAQVGEAQRGADERYALTFIASQRLYQAVDLAVLAYQLQWRTPQQASALLEAQGTLSIQEISIWPNWFPRLPLVAARIDILWLWESP